MNQLKNPPDIEGSSKEARPLHKGARGTRVKIAGLHLSHGRDRRKQPLRAPVSGRFSRLIPVRIRDLRPIRHRSVKSPAGN